jgi:hypothetical protein
MLRVGVWVGVIVWVGVRVGVIVWVGKGRCNSKGRIVNKGER